jgi:hypothetical protein
MKSAPRGAVTSEVEVSGISAHGIWLFLGDREVFLSFKDFPWFRKAPVGGVLRVERPAPHHLYWPELDIDLSVESILDPARYPLVSREKPARRTGSLRTRKRTPSPRRTRRA